MKKTIEIEIPEGYEVDKSVEISSGCIVKFRKMEEKDFMDYFNDYLKYLESFSTAVYLGYTAAFSMGEYDEIRFEIKIGLFKFICDELKLDWTTEIALVFNPRPISKELYRICPAEFINSIR
jgi:hypothetical protein